MRFIELTSSETLEPFIVNVSRLDLMYRSQDEEFTVLRIDGHDVGVKETPDDILQKIRG